MLLAEFHVSPQRLVDELAVLFLIVRIAYVFTYLGNRPTLRSILWSLGFAINVGIYFLPLIRSYWAVSQDPALVIPRCAIAHLRARGSTRSAAR